MNGSTTTASPTARPSTPSPSSSTTPENSCPNTTGSVSPDRGAAASPTARAGTGLEVEVQVRAADPRPRGPDLHGPRPGLGLRDVLDPEVFLAVVPRRLHRAHLVRRAARTGRCAAAGPDGSSVHPRRPVIPDRTSTVGGRPRPGLRRRSRRTGPVVVDRDTGARDADLDPDPRPDRARRRAPARAGRSPRVTDRWTWPAYVGLLGAPCSSPPSSCPRSRGSTGGTAA